MTDTIPEKPDDIFMLQAKGGPIEVFMSAGLRSILTSILDQTSMVNLYTDHALQEVVVLELLRPRKPNGHPTEEEFTLFSVPMSGSEMTRLVRWAGDHVLYFFIEMTQSGTEALTGPRIAQLTRLLDGMKDSLQQKLSVGGLTASPVNSEASSGQTATKTSE